LLWELLQAQVPMPRRPKDNFQISKKPQCPPLRLPPAPGRTGLLSVHLSYQTLVPVFVGLFYSYEKCPHPPCNINLIYCFFFKVYNILRKKQNIPFPTSPNPLHFPQAALPFPVPPNTEYHLTVTDLPYPIHEYRIAFYVLRFTSSPLPFSPSSG